VGEDREPYIDNLNCIALTSRLHVDVGGYDYRPTPFNPLHPSIPWTVPQNLDDGINARRARIGVIGTFQGDWVYSLIFDLGGSSDGFGSSTRVASSHPDAGSDCCRGRHHVRNSDRLSELPGL
jgi:phosphate-selective porin OprO/OprP